MIAGVVIAFGVLGAPSLTPGALAPCTLETAGLGRTEAKCGSVVVDDGVSVGFAVLEATGHKKLADPVVLLPGGPGQAATDLAGFAQIELGAALKDRDVVLFDPRGTGRSQGLKCVDARPLELRLAADDAAEKLRLEACARAIGAVTGALDPKSITTARIAKDLEAVRGALGVTTWNLLGISYGTRIALAYDRAFPGKARALVLDSVVPFSMVVGQTAARDAEAALAALDARCVSCAKDTLAHVIGKVHAALEDTAADVTVPHPSTGKPASLQVTGKIAAGLVRLLLYSDASAAVIPPILAAADEGDYRPLAAQLWLAEKETDTISEPMQLSVLCAEDVPLFVEDEAERTSPFGGFQKQMRAACDAWPHAVVDKSFHDDAPTSATPALLLAGGADPVTPPAAAEAARKTLVNARVVVARGLGHNPGMQGCLPAQIARFLDDPAHVVAGGGAGAGDDELARCAARLGPFPAFVDAMGPKP